MAGSRKYLLYDTDSGSTFALAADESNSELAGTAVDFPNGGQATVPFVLPKNVKPRRAIYTSADGNVVRVAYICAVDGVPNASFTDPVSGVSVALTAIKAEEVALPKGEDTGLIDGDAT
jgi:hypothetical protein